MNITVENNIKIIKMGDKGPNLLSVDRAQKIIQELNYDDCKAVIILGNEKVFSAGLNLKDLSNAKEIAIDLETRDDGISNGYGAGWATNRGEIVGFAVAVEGWQGYFPFGHLGGGNMIPEQVKAYMKKICALPCPKIFHNAQYDVGWLEASGIKVNGEIIDTMIAAALIDENRFQYSLNSLSLDYLGEIKAETDEIFISGATVDNVEIIDAITANRLRATGGDVVTDSVTISSGIQSV